MRSTHRVTRRAVMTVRATRGLHFVVKIGTKGGGVKSPGNGILIVNIVEKHKSGGDFY
jgi:hypothetical protein